MQWLTLRTLPGVPVAPGAYKMPKSDRQTWPYWSNMGVGRLQIQVPQSFRLSAVSQSALWIAA